MNLSLALTLFTALSSTASAAVDDPSPSIWEIEKNRNLRAGGNNNNNSNLFRNGPPGNVPPGNGPPEKVDICHFQEDEGVWKKITISEKAVPKHMENHDDAKPGEATSGSGTLLDDDCATLPPTQSPSSSPTGSPSSSPSQSPTTSPSQSPTSSPSSSPSKAPTGSPTMEPSKSPSRAPSSSPSGSPTMEPSKSPSHAPSLSPTGSPIIARPTCGAPVVYEQQFVARQTASAAVKQAWDTFQASLTGTSYCQVTISGNLDPTGVTCSDPTAVNALANALNTNAAVSVQCNGRTWNTGDCFGGASTEFNSKQLGDTLVCQCDPEYVIRPKIPNENWGGIGGNGSCSDGRSSNPIFNALSQTIRVEFS